MASRVRGFLNMYLKIALLENITREIKRHEAGKRGACADVTPSVTRSPGVTTLRSLHARPSDRGRRPTACAPGAAQSGAVRCPERAALAPAASRGRPFPRPPTPVCAFRRFPRRGIPAACTPRRPLAPGNRPAMPQATPRPAAPAVLHAGGSGASHAARWSSPPSSTVAPPPAAPVTRGVSHAGPGGCPAPPGPPVITQLPWLWVLPPPFLKCLLPDCRPCPEPRHAVLPVTVAVPCRPSSPAVLPECSLSLRLRVSLPTPPRALL